MNQFARPAMKCQAAPLSTSKLWLDVEVLADRHEALAALSPLEDDPLAEADDAGEETSDDLPF